jgi:branched-chain amino acid transport system permease protein
MSASVLFFIGRSGYVLPPFGGERAFVVLDAVLGSHALWLIAIALGITVALRLFYHRTTLGLAMMAASIDPDGAATTGIDVTRMRTLTFALGGILGAVAGILVTPLTSVDFAMGINLTLKGFAAAVGGITLGLMESLATVAVSSSYKDVVALSVLIAIMIFMPHGMLGRAGRRGG